MSNRLPVRMLTLLLPLAVGLAGCSSTGSFPELYPLSGSVRQGDRPVKTGGLIFVPESGDGGGLNMNAVVEADGTFQARTSRNGAKNAVELNQGLPAGRYRVIYHPPSDGSKTGLEVELEERVTVQPGDNKVTLKLPAQLPESHSPPRDDIRQP